MTEMMLDVEPIKPRWVLLKEKHDIETSFDETHQHWQAVWDRNHHVPIKHYGDSEREAVIKVIHLMKLDGWMDVSA
jgi:hypothetical protein